VNSPETILLIGGGGHCVSVIDVIEREGKYKIFGVTDKAERIGQNVLDYGIIGTDDDLENLYEKCKHAIVTVGQIRTPNLRISLYEKLKAIGYILPAIVSPLAYVSKHATLGEGTVIMHQALINAGAAIGNNCIINSKALIEHDSIIEDNCHISTGAIVNGGVRIRKNTFFGSNAVSQDHLESNEADFIPANSLLKRARHGQ